MSRFSSGQRVMFVANPQQRGEVVFVHPLSGGHQYYDVRRDDGGQEIVLEQDLREEVVATSAWDLLASNALGSHAEFGIATTLHKVKNTTNNTISSLRASRTLFKPYQYKPLIKYLQSDGKRILIADEVGLGKTIEAGHILLELRGRQMLRNALIVCPKSLMTNWQTELLEKFNFAFKHYETTSDFINDIDQDLNAARRTIFGIVNYEKCRNKKLLDLLADRGYLFDLLICDEAHRLRNSSTQLYEAFSQIVHHAESLVFLTATPIMNSVEDLYNMVRLLDGKRYNNFEVFQNAISQNRPFIRALSALNRGEPLDDIAAALHESTVRTTITIGEEFSFQDESTVEELFEEDPLYRRARDRMLSREDGPATRARIQYDLSELNSLNHLFTRTRKREVSTDSPTVQRIPHRKLVHLSDPERALYDAVAERYEGLGVIQHKRMITSSIVAYHTPRDDLRAGTYRDDIPDAKFDRFNEIIDEVVGQHGKKVIVFATFKDTLHYLEIKLAELGIGTAIIHGDIDDRAERVAYFRDDPGTSVLLSSQVGREGLNMQFCDAIINYDLPWNPMRVEQRIGRVDRIGQKSPVVNIYSFTIRDTIEERIYERLLEKINVFQESLGDLEEILADENESVGQMVSELEEKLYRTQLTEKEQNQIIDETARAIELRKMDLNKIEEELTDAIVNDIHFQNEIRRIVENRRYLTDIELRGFVESILRAKIPTHFLAPDGAGRYVLKVPNNDRYALFRFIESYKDPVEANPELDVLYRQLKQRFWGELSIPVTFSQEVAYQSTDHVVFINSYHPLINAAANYFEEGHYHINQSYRLGLDRREAEDLDLPPGHYILTVFKVALQKASSEGVRVSTYLYAVLTDLNGEEPVILDEETSARVLGIAQLQVTAPADPVPFNPDLVQVIRSPIALTIMNKQRERLEDEQIRLDSSALRRRMQQEQFYENQIQRRRELLDQGRGIRDILVDAIDRLEQERERALSEIESQRVTASNDIVSINHLHIF